MAKNDRCQMCDYSEGLGSVSAGLSPGKHGKVRRYGLDMICDVCHGSAADSVTEMVMADEAKEKEEEDNIIQWPLGYGR